METLAKQSEAMELVYDAYQEFEKDSELQDMHWARQERMYTFEMRLEDEKYAIRQRSLKEGIEQGIEEGIQQTARAMITEGFETEKISKITGLSLEDIERL